MAQRAKWWVLLCLKSFESDTVALVLSGCGGFVYRTCAFPEFSISVFSFSLFDRKNRGKNFPRWSFLTRRTAEWRFRPTARRSCSSGSASSVSSTCLIRSLMWVVCMLACLRRLFRKIKILLKPPFLREVLLLLFCKWSFKCDELHVIICFFRRWTEFGLKCAVFSCQTSKSISYPPLRCRCKVVVKLSCLTQTET